MVIRRPHRSAGFLLLASLSAYLAAPAGAQIRDPARDTRVPVAYLSGCPALRVASQESVPPGTALALSQDGRFLLTYVHTPRGAEFTLRERDTAETRRFEVATPQLPPGVAWRVLAAEFSSDDQWIAVRSIGAIWVVEVTTAKIAATIGVESAGQLYPGKSSWGGDRLTVLFWPPESLLADAAARKPVEARIYEFPGGAMARRLSLDLRTSNAWTEPRLSSDGESLAVLKRARSWPGSARLLLYSVKSGKPLWERKIGAEDVAWSPDGKQLLALGSQLKRVDAKNGKVLSHADTKIRFSEFQKLRVNGPADAALGLFAKYNPFTRTLTQPNGRESILVLWKLDTGKELCRVKINPAADLSPRLTDGSEVVDLEETYDVRPELRLLKSARIVTYHLAVPKKP